MEKCVRERTFSRPESIKEYTSSGSVRRRVTAVIIINTRWERNKVIKKGPIGILKNNTKKFGIITKNKLNNKKDQEEIRIIELTQYINNSIHAVKKSICFKNKMLDRPISQKPH